MFRRALLIISLLGLAALGFWQVLPPDDSLNHPRKENFVSIERAHGGVNRIAKEPHPIQSAANAAVRQYLLDQLNLLSESLPRTLFERLCAQRPMTIQVQSIDVDRPELPPRRVHNIVARIRGTQRLQQGAIMLVAHYDSHPDSRGAADDGAAVMAIIESVRSIIARKMTARDIIILLTDGEEYGLLGAIGFCAAKPPEGDGANPWLLELNTSGWPRSRGQGHPWVKDVAIALNFEARGSRGASVMFETAPANLALVQSFAQNAAFPMGSSVGDDIYRLLRDLARNNTDFTVLRKAGLKGLNFAFIGGFENYHRITDDYANLDKNALYHHATHAVSLTRHFGNLDDQAMNAVLDPGQPQAVYFNTAGFQMVVYPQTWNWPLTGAQVALTALAIMILAMWRVDPATQPASRRVRGAKPAAAPGLRRMVTPLGLFGALVRLLVAVPLVFCIVFFTTDKIDPALLGKWFEVFFGSAVLLTVIITLPLALVMRRRSTLADIAAAALILWAVLGVLANLYMPGASYLFAWPGMFASVGIIALALLGRSWLALLPAALLVAAPAWLAWKNLLDLIDPIIALSLPHIAIASGIALILLMLLGRRSATISLSLLATWPLLLLWTPVTYLAHAALAPAPLKASALATVGVVLVIWLLTAVLVLAWRDTSPTPRPVVEPDPARQPPVPA